MIRIMPYRNAYGVIVGDVCLPCRRVNSLRRIWDHYGSQGILITPRYDNPFPKTTWVPAYARGAT